MIFRFILLALGLGILWTLVRWLGGIRGGAPFIPVSRKWLDEAFATVRLGREDVLVDLGSGSGRILLAAAKRGARVIGHEYHPVLVWWSRLSLRIFSDRAQVIRGDLFQAQLTSATIVTIFGLSSMKERLEMLLRTHANPGTRVIVFVTPKLSLPILVERPFFTVYRVE